MMYKFNVDTLSEYHTLSIISNIVVSIATVILLWLLIVPLKVDSGAI